jgi:hypothetical protein
MKIEKTTSAYEHLERVCQAIKGKRNLAQQDTATIATLAVIDEVVDYISSGKTLDDLIGDAGKEKRISIRNNIKFLFTASKNVQNTVCVDMGLLPKAEGGASVEEFV